MEGRAPPRRHRRDHDRRLITARDIRRQTLGCASVQQFPPSEGVPVGGWACQDRRVAAPSVVQVSLGLGDEIARTRRSTKRAIVLAAAALPLAAAVGMTVAWSLSHKDEKAATRQIQAYYDQTSLGAGVVTVGRCIAGTDAERSVDLRVCRVLSATRSVFAISPAPEIADRSARLCFMVSSEGVEFFGIRRRGSAHDCLVAAGRPPFYRGWRRRIRGWSGVIGNRLGQRAGMSPEGGPRKPLLRPTRSGERTLSGRSSNRGGRRVHRLLVAQAIGKPAE